MIKNRYLYHIILLTFFIILFLLELILFNSTQNQKNTSFAGTYINYHKVRSFSGDNGKNGVVGKYGNYDTGTISVSFSNVVMDNYTWVDEYKGYDASGDVSNSDVSGYARLISSAWGRPQMSYDYKITATAKAGFIVTGLSEVTSFSSTYVIDTSSGQSSKSISGSGSTRGGAVGSSTNNYYYIATFAPINYKVSFNGNGNTGGSMSNQTFTYTKSQNLSLNQFTKSGYNFAGWSTSPNGDKAYDDGQSVSNLTTTHGGTVTLYAKWTLNNYSISFNTNGGNSIPNMSYNIESTSTLPLPTRSGYTFNSWQVTSSSGSWEYNSTYGSGASVKGKYGSPTLKANWSLYQLTANANNGSIPSTSGWSGSGSTATKNITLGNTYGTLPTPTRTGYSFDGWYTSASGGSQVTSSTVMKGSTTIYAKWTSISYSADFNVNNGSMVSNFSYNIESTNTLPSTLRDGHTFNGWKPSSSSGNWYSSTIYLAGKSVKGMYGNVTFNAQWTPYNWGINYCNNHTPSDTTFFSQGGYKYGNHVDINYIPKSKEGYTFIGWNTNRDGTGINCINTSSIENKIEKDEEYIEIFAQWRKNTYYVRYNGNASGKGVDGNCQSSDSVIGTMSNSTHYYDTPKKLTDNAFTRRGYTFQGWSRDSNATGATYGNEAPVSDLTSTDNATVDLYAIWKRNWYTISFDANGGTGELSSLTVLYNSGNKTLPKCGYSRPGYVFEGWTDSVGNYYKDSASISSKIDKNITLYAKWKATWMADIMTKEEFSGGSGTKEDPYKIETAEDLAYLSRLVQENSPKAVGYFKQIAPIDLSGKIWFPIGGNYLDNGSESPSFSGVYDGRGFAIMGLETCSQTDANGNYLYSSVGLFGKTNGADLQNINLFNAKIYGKDSVGALVGESVGQLKIYGSFARANIQGSAKVGGLVGKDVNPFTDEEKISLITNSGFAGSVTGGSIIVGTMTGGKIENCYAEVNSDISFCGSSSGVTLDACVFETSEGKYYYSDKTPKNGITFDGWTTYQGKPLPSGITWVGGVSDNGADLTGYTLVS